MIDESPDGCLAQVEWLEPNLEAGNVEQGYFKYTV